MVLTSPLTLYRKKTTGSGSDKFDELCLNATNFSVTVGGSTYNLSTILGNKQDTISAGTGLSLSGTTLNHSNSITAQSTQAVYPITIDAQGHVSSYGTAATIGDLGGWSTIGITAASTVAVSTAAPSASSTNSQIPTSAAVYQAISSFSTATVELISGNDYRLIL